MPSSAAICICGRPLLSKRATASRLNSGGELPPRLRHQITFLAHTERIRGAHRSGGRSIVEGLERQKVGLRVLDLGLDTSTGTGQLMLTSWARSLSLSAR